MGPNIWNVLEHMSSDLFAALHGGYLHSDSMLAFVLVKALRAALPGIRIGYLAREPCTAPVVPALVAMTEGNPSRVVFGCELKAAERFPVFTPDETAAWPGALRSRDLPVPKFGPDSRLLGYEPVCKNSCFVMGWLVAAPETVLERARRDQDGRTPPCFRTRWRTEVRSPGSGANDQGLLLYLAGNAP